MGLSLIYQNRKFKLFLGCCIALLGLALTGCGGGSSFDEIGSVGFRGTAANNNNNNNNNNNTGVPITVRFGNPIARNESGVLNHMLPGVPDADSVEIVLIDENGEVIESPGSFEVTTTNPDTTSTVNTNTIDLGGTITGIKITFNSSVRPAKIQFLFKTGTTNVGISSADIPANGEVVVEDPPVQELTGGSDNLANDCTVDPTELTLNPNASGNIRVLFNGLNITRHFSFTSEAPGIASVDANGRVTAGSTGDRSTRIFVRFGQVVKIVPVNVRVVNSLVANPANPTVIQGNMLRLGALNNGVEAVGVWAGGNQQVGQVNPAGVFTAIGPGMVTVTFTEDGTGTVLNVVVEVTANAVTNVGLLQEDLTVSSGSQIFYKFRLDFANGDSQVTDGSNGGCSLTSSSNPSVCEISGSNLVRCGSVGSSILSGTCNFNGQQFNYQTSCRVRNWSFFTGVGGCSITNRNLGSGALTVLDSFSDNINVSSVRASTVDPTFRYIYYCPQLSGSNVFTLKCVGVNSDGSFGSLISTTNLPLSAGIPTSLNFQRFYANQTFVGRLYCGFDTGTLKTFSTNISSGAVLQEIGSISTTRSPLSGCFMDPDQRFLYCSSSNSNGFTRFRISSFLTPIDSTNVLSSCSSPTSLTFVRLGQQFRAFCGGSSGVSFFNYTGTTGDFNALSTLVPPTGFICSDVKVTPRRVYFMCNDASGTNGFLQTCEFDGNSIDTATSVQDSIFAATNILLQRDFSTNTTFVDSSSTFFTSNFTVQRRFQEGLSTPIFEFQDSFDFVHALQNALNNFIMGWI